MLLLYKKKIKQQQQQTTQGKFCNELEAVNTSSVEQSLPSLNKECLGLKNKECLGVLSLSCPPTSNKRQLYRVPLYLCNFQNFNYQETFTLISSQVMSLVYTITCINHRQVLPFWKRMCNCLFLKEYANLRSFELFFFSETSIPGARLSITVFL